MPNNELALALLKEVGPLAVSSANLTGEPAANNVDEAEKYFGEKVPVYLDGGKAAAGAPSTIVDLTEDDVVRIVRVGVISVADITELVGEDAKVEN
jgi:tRNA threonylcarbamoyl adenosine modification protein (Sua5/YciO/YrdC/YwlC family)